MSENRTIYVVDDSMTARMWARMALQNLKPEWEVVDACDGQDALTKTPEQRPDALLIDINMPGLDGFEVAAKVRDQYPEVPIAMLTANVQARIQTRAAESGYAFIAKPVSPDKLRAFVEAVS